MKKVFLLSFTLVIAGIFFITPAPAIAVDTATEADCNVVNKTYDPRTGTCVPLPAPSSGGGINTSYIKGYGDSIIGVINTILVPVLIAIAFIVFLWGAYKSYIYHADSDTERSKGHQLMLWGVIGFVIIFSLWGLVNIVRTTLNLSTGTAPPFPTIGGSTGAPRGETTLPIYRTGSTPTFGGVPAGGGTSAQKAAQNQAKQQAGTRGGSIINYSTCIAAGASQATCEAGYSNSTSGCKDPYAENYNPSATGYNGCTYPNATTGSGCADPKADNYVEGAAGYNDCQYGSSPEGEPPPGNGDGSGSSPDGWDYNSNQPATETSPDPQSIEKCYNDEDEEVPC